MKNSYRHMLIWSLLVLMIFFSGCKPGTHTLPVLPSTTMQPSLIETIEPTGTPIPVVSPTPSQLTWRDLGPGDAIVDALAINPDKPSMLYAGTTDSIYKSLDGGETWRQIYSYDANESEFIKTLVINLFDTHIMYAAVYGRGILKSTNTGESWVAVNGGLNDYKVLALMMDPSDPDILYTGTLSGVYRSTDAGNIWKPLNQGLKSGQINALAIDPTDPAVVYAGHNQEGVYKSVDGGASWKKMSGGLNIMVGDMQAPAPTWVNVLAIDPSNSDILYLGGYGVFKSIDGGHNWQPIYTGLDYFNDGIPGNITHITIDPTSPNIVYAVEGRNTLFRSNDGGKTWKVFTENMAVSWYYGPDSPVLLDPLDSTILYVGTWGNGVFTTRQEILPTAIPAATQADCTRGWTQLKVGMQAVVSGEEGDTPNRVRSGPSKDSQMIDQIDPGTPVSIVSGPVCADNYVFWKVQYANGVGWTAEGDFSTYWLEP